MKLNSAQQSAVDHIYGPLLVLAGPGTGKTQLLSARIANILQTTDANAQNILCLTFTEKAAQNMRERLSSIIKDHAYDVHINTYHGFGSDIIRSYPEYFENIDLETGKDSRLEKPIDQLQQIQIMTDLVNKLPYSSPLISAKNYIKNVVSTISELKRGLYTPQSLRNLADKNLSQVKKLSPEIAAHLAEIKRFPSKSETAIELFSGISEVLSGKEGLAEMAFYELEQAMAMASDSGKSNPLTTWKNSWLSKDADNYYRFTDENQHLRMIELANLYEKYQNSLEENQLYDFDDMILRTIDALKNRPELKYNLQEKYHFILLDEFQDTNSAQFELVKLLADNPVNEGQPNIFAVGDDDQAIYAFQGARVSNMLGFIHSFRDVAVINLTENYRSHPDIIHTAHGIAGQIESRLHNQIEGIEKTLTASAQSMPENSDIERHEFSSEASENSWIADRIKKLTDTGTDPSEIAVLAPKHSLLENIVPFLAKNKTPITYEKRENILQTQMMRSFRTMIELTVAVSENNDAKINYLMPQVLSLDFYQIPIKDIWEINWTYRSREDARSWVEIALDFENIAPHVLFYLNLGMKALNEPLEYILDYITGNMELNLDEETQYISPLKKYYFSDKDNDTLRYFESLANLSTIREHLRSHQNNNDSLLGADDFLNFINAYESAGQPLINTHPIAQSTKSVQLMTVYKAKGLEFEHVFLLSLHDDIWGKKARSNSNKLSLPANLQHIRYQGSDEDELRRLLFVAITRAKHGLYLTSHANKDNGKSTEPVKYLLEFENESRVRSSTVLPLNKQKVVQTVFTAQDTMSQIDTMWHSRHVKLDADLKSLLKPRLDKYQMSPTHLNSFIDMEYGGPETFLIQTLLRFPQAPGEDGEFGNAIHITLDWHQRRTADGRSPTSQRTLEEYDRNLDKRYIPSERMDDFRNRGHYALNKYLDSRENMLNLDAKSEVDFRLEGVLLGEAHLSGKIDRLEINKKNKTVNIVDFKTGKPHEKWERSVKLLKYKQQLYFYKFLIEGSHTWQGYKVAEARLEFVEPNTEGIIVPALKIDFDKFEEAEMKKLIQEVWAMIKNLDLPDCSKFSDDFKGTMDFVAFCLSKK